MLLFFHLILKILNIFLVIMLLPLNHPFPIINTIFYLLKQTDFKTSLNSCKMKFKKNKDFPFFNSFILSNLKPYDHYSIGYCPCCATGNCVGCCAYWFP